MIYLTFNLAATNNDLLLNTRLSSIPHNGVLTIQALANLSNLTNFYGITIALPDGNIPVDLQSVSAGQEVEGALGGQLDNRLLDQWSFPASQGGHFTVGLTETGTAVCRIRVVLRP